MIFLNKKSRHEEVVYEKEGLKILIYKHPDTVEASKPDWAMFNEHFIDVFNKNIFSQPGNAALPESNPLILKDKHVVAYEDLERIVFSHVLDSVDNVHEMMRSVRKRSFCLEYELPLNKRFIDIFTEMLEPLDFVVTDSLPQDTVTIFGKSRPDIVVYKSKGRFIKDSSTVAGATIMDEGECEVNGATLELKRSVVHLKSRSAELAQCCANMVRVSGYLTERAL